MDVKRIQSIGPSLAAVAGAALVLSSPSPAAAPTASRPGAAPAAALRRVLGPEAAEAVHPHRLAARPSATAGAARVRPARAADPGPASQVGAWEPPFQIGNYAIHAALLPTGKVLFWGYPQANPITGARANAGEAVVWDPARGTGAASLTARTPPLVSVAGETVAAPLFCSGQSPLPDGELLVTGGTLAYPNPVTGADWMGVNTAFTFDPWSETWTRQPDMLQGRWYPSQTELPSGQVAVLSGYTGAEPGGQFNSDLEVFTPPASVGGTGTFVHETQGDRRTSLYPHMTVMPDGQALLLGPEKDYSQWGIHWDAGFLNPGTFTWTNSFPGLAADRFGSNSVLVPSRDPRGSNRVMVIGGAQGDPAVAVDSTQTFDESRAAAGPQTAAAHLNVARWYPNTVLLPDGSMVTVGGGAGSSGGSWYWTNGDDPALRQVELYDPSTGSWRLGPAQQYFRTYHSVALLLPDGRVLSAGDDFHDDVTGTQTAEIYDPPYLRTGTPRPVISSAPARATYGGSFWVDSPSSITRAVLISPGAVTHGVDMSQRYVQLGIQGSISGSGVQLAAPPSANAAPPGYYMLFLLDAQGVPSIARWVRLGEAAVAPAPGQSLGGALPAPTGALAALPAPASARGGASAERSSHGVSARLRPRLIVPAQTLAEVRRRRSLRVRVRVAAAETVELTLRLAAGGAAAHGATVPLSRARRTLAVPQTVTIDLRLSRAAIARLQRTVPARLEIVGSAFSGRGAALPFRRLVALRRGHG